MNNVVAELLASQIPAVARPFVLALCMGEGGIDADAWRRCYGDRVGGPTTYQGPLNVVFNSSNKLWPGKDNSHALGPGQFQPATYEEAAARTGLPTLAEQSQLANLYNHLQHVYTRAGGHLETDLASGKQLDVAAALPSTWTSLGIAEAFKAHYARALNMLASAPVVPTPAPADPTPADPSVDPEIQAMIDMIAGLTPLDPAGQKRAIAYVMARLNIS